MRDLTNYDLLKIAAALLFILVATAAVGAYTIWRHNTAREKKEVVIIKIVEVVDPEDEEKPLLLILKDLSPRAVANILSVLPPEVKDSVLLAMPDGRREEIQRIMDSKKPPAVNSG